MAYPTLVADCPRCGAKEHTFDVPASIDTGNHGVADWTKQWEVAAVCRRCVRPTIFLLQIQSHENRALPERDGYWTNEFNLNQVFRILQFISPRREIERTTPEHCPAEITAAFSEGATCMSVGCYNAASAMFRLCLDLATRGLLPPPPAEGAEAAEGQPNRRQRRDLGLRIPWLIENRRLPAELADLAEAVREDGNDGAHAGNLGKDDADDLADFTEVLLERMFTEPAKIELAKARRIERRDQLNQA